MKPYLVALRMPWIYPIRPVSDSNVMHLVEFIPDCVVGSIEFKVRGWPIVMSLRCVCVCYAFLGHGPLIVFIQGFFLIFYSSMHSSACVYLSLVPILHTHTYYHVPSHMCVYYVHVSHMHIHTVPAEPVSDTTHDDFSPFTPYAREKRIALLRQYPYPISLSLPPSPSPLSSFPLTQSCVSLHW